MIFILIWCDFIFNSILLIFSPEIDENEIDDHSDLGFVQPNEPNVKPYLFEKFRSAAINDLKLFLKLRSEELSDNGEGLFLMVGGGSLGYDMFDSKNPYGGQNVGFLDCWNEYCYIVLLNGKQTKIDMDS